MKDTKRYSILFRVSNGLKDDKRVKLSTEVAPKDLDAFWLKYVTVLKAGFSDLKKVKKNKKSKKAPKKAVA